MTTWLSLAAFIIVSWLWLLIMCLGVDFFFFFNFTTWSSLGFSYLQNTVFHRIGAFWHYSQIIFCHFSPVFLEHLLCVHWHTWWRPTGLWGTAHFSSFSFFFCFCGLFQFSSFQIYGFFLLPLWQALLKFSALHDFFVIYLSTPVISSFIMYVSLLLFSIWFESVSYFHFFRHDFLYFLT